MGKRTQVYEYHRQHGNIVEFAGYDLPVWYEGIIPECKAVRNQAGIFDVSHMGRVIVEGDSAESFLNNVTTNDVSALPVGGGHYSLFCNPEGGIIDDLTIFRLEPAMFLLVYNAGNREKDWGWLMKHFGPKGPIISDISDNVAMFAVQGPNASVILKTTSGTTLENLEKYAPQEVNIAGAKCLITRSGYTGEDGFEVYVWDASPEKPAKAMNVWNILLSNGSKHGLRPAGLGARDVLRLEAGMCLYGNDLDEGTSPVEAKLGWAVRLEKHEFIGKDAIVKVKKSGPKRVRVGFRMLEKSIPRQDQMILSNGETVGKVTSGTLSPTLGVGIGMGFVTPQLSGRGQKLNVRIRDRAVPAKTVKLPFYQRRSQGGVVAFGEEMGLSDFRSKYPSS